MQLHVPPTLNVEAAACSKHPRLAEPVPAFCGTAHSLLQAARKCLVILEPWHVHIAAACLAACGRWVSIRASSVAAWACAAPKPTRTAAFTLGKGSSVVATDCTVTAPAIWHAPSSHPAAQFARGDV